MNRIAQVIALGLALLSPAHAVEETPPLRDIVDHVLSSVAYISVELSEPTDASNQNSQVKTRDGTGMVLSSGGHIITAIHVIEKANKIAVIFSNNIRSTAQVVGTDPETGVALLKVSGASGLIPVHFGDAHPLKRGDPIFFIGSPAGLRGSVLTGIVSALRTTGGPFSHLLLQPSFAVQPGDDGAPLFNLKGEVVGMITSNYARSGRPTGIGLAVTSNIVKEVGEKLQKFGVVERGWLGVQLRKPTSQEEAMLGLPHEGGAVIVKLLEDGPAIKSGLAAGDAIATLNGEPVRNVAWFASSITNLSPGTEVTLGTRRATGKSDAKVKLGKLSPSQAPPTPVESNKPTDESSGCVRYVPSAGLTVSVRCDE
jgi:S1-C subfamily serine protease